MFPILVPCIKNHAISPSPQSEGKDESCCPLIPIVKKVCRSVKSKKSVGEQFENAKAITFRLHNDLKKYSFKSQAITNIVDSIFPRHMLKRNGNGNFLDFLQRVIKINIEDRNFITLRSFLIEFSDMKRLQIVKMIGHNGDSPFDFIHSSSFHNLLNELLADFGDGKKYLNLLNDALCHFSDKKFQKALRKPFICNKRKAIWNEMQRCSDLFARFLKLQKEIPTITGHEYYIKIAQTSKVNKLLRKSLKKLSNEEIQKLIESIKTERSRAKIDLSLGIKSTRLAMAEKIQKMICSINKSRNEIRELRERFLPLVQVFSDYHHKGTLPTSWPLEISFPFWDNTTFTFNFGEQDTQEISYEAVQKGASIFNQKLVDDVQLVPIKKRILKAFSHDCIKIGGKLFIKREIKIFRKIERSTHLTEKQIAFGIKHGEIVHNDKCYNSNKIPEFKYVINALKIYPYNEETFSPLLFSSRLVEFVAISRFMNEFIDRLYSIELSGISPVITKLMRIKKHILNPIKNPLSNKDIWDMRKHHSVKTFS